MRHRTSAYWPTRIMLAVGLIGTVTAVAGALVLMLAATPMFGPEPTVLGLPNRVVVAALGGAVAVFGLGWMVRIYRANPEPDRRSWRYRR